MSDTQFMMHEFRYLDEKRKLANVSAAEEQRWIELGQYLGIFESPEPFAMAAQYPSHPQGYYADDGNWYEYPSGYDPNAYPAPSGGFESQFAPHTAPAGSFENQAPFEFGPNLQSLPPPDTVMEVDPADVMEVDPSDIELIEPGPVQSARVLIPELSIGLGAEFAPPEANAATQSANGLAPAVWTQIAGDLAAGNRDAMSPTGVLPPDVPLLDFSDADFSPPQPIETANNGAPPTLELLEPIPQEPAEFGASTTVEVAAPESAPLEPVSESAALESAASESAAPGSAPLEPFSKSAAPEPAPSLDGPSDVPSEPIIDLLETETLAEAAARIESALASGPGLASPEPYAGPVEQPASTPREFSLQEFEQFPEDQPSSASPLKSEPSIANVPREDPGPKSEPLPPDPPQSFGDGKDMLSSSFVQGEHRVVLHTLEGQVKRGTVRDMDLMADSVTVEGSAGGAAERFPMAGIKAIFFLLGTGMDRPLPQGQKIRVSFQDGREMVGFSIDFKSSDIGFFLTPAESRSNTARIYVLRQGLAGLTEL